MDIEKVIQNPTEYFTSPAEIATAPGLTVEQKIRVLESWEVDAERILDSSAENMTGDDEQAITIQLQEIHTTLSDLRGD